jgi:hypothetical protein
MNAKEALQLLIRINRVFDAVSCTWTGEARGYLAELVAWSARHDWSTTPDLLPLKQAIEHASDASEPWGRRCQLLSSHSCLVERRLMDLMGWSDRTT